LFLIGWSHYLQFSYIEQDSEQQGVGFDIFINTASEKRILLAVKQKVWTIEI